MIVESVVTLTLVLKRDCPVKQRLTQVKEIDMGYFDIINRAWKGKLWVKCYIFKRVYVLVWCMQMNV